MISQLNLVPKKEPYSILKSLSFSFSRDLNILCYLLQPVKFVITRYNIPSINFLALICFQAWMDYEAIGPCHYLSLFD